MNWFKRLLMGLLPPAGTVIAKRFAATHAIVVAVTVFALASPVIHGETGLGGLCVLFAWLGLAALHVESAFNGALSRYAGGTAALAVSLMAGCAVGWVGLPLLLAVLVGSIVVIGLGIGWRRGAYPTAVGAAIATLVFVEQLASTQVAIVIALIVGLGAFTLIRRNQEESQRGRFRSLASITVGTVMTVLGTGIVIMVVASNVLTDADVDTDVTNLVTHNFTDPDTIAMVSMFRSQFGHTYADSTRSVSSMKHYVLRETSSGPLYAPFDGEVFQLLSGWGGGSGGYDLWVRPTLQPNVSIRLFHIQPTTQLMTHFGIKSEGFGLENNLKIMLGLPTTNPPFAVKAGDLLGTGEGEIALTVTDWADPLPTFCTEPLVWSLPTMFSPTCARQNRLVSVFEAMTPDVAGEWEAWGLTPEKIIITDKEREIFDIFGAGLDPNFRPHGEQEQIEKLYSLGLPVITGSSGDVDLEFPIGGVLLMYSTDGIRVHLPDGRDVEGASNGLDGVINPLYLKAPSTNIDTMFTVRLTGTSAWKAVVVPPEEIDRVVRPLASLLASSGQYVTRGSGR